VRKLYKIVKRYFERGIYSADDVSAFVRAGKLSAEEYRQITGGEYTE